MQEIIAYSVRCTTEEEKKANMPYVTSSKIEALNTCPKWGLVNSVYNKVFVTGYRQMALEAGSLMHDVFAMINFYQVGAMQGLTEHAMYHGKFDYPNGRFEQVTEDGKFLTSDFANDISTLERLLYNIIATSDFYDDPEDKNRTLTNLEFMSMVLADYWLKSMAKFDVYIENKDDPTSRIGSELSLDVVYQIEYDDGSIKEFRFIGLCDVLYQSQDGKRIKLGEYKTASHMNEAWDKSFLTRHQLTAYHSALQAYFSKSLLTDEILLLGSTVPVRRSAPPVKLKTYKRYDFQVHAFLSTAVKALELIENYNEETVTLAPMYTHSCNRFFRPCSLLDLCVVPQEDQKVLFKQMKNKDELSPSEMKALLRHGGT